MSGKFVPFLDTILLLFKTDLLTMNFLFCRSQYAGLILALFGTALSLIPFIFMKFGPKLRARSKLAKVY